MILNVECKCDNTNTDTVTVTRSNTYFDYTHYLLQYYKYAAEAAPIPGGPPIALRYRYWVTLLLVLLFQLLLSSLFAVLARRVNFCRVLPRFTPVLLT